jgi:hypothetical protein
MTAAAAIKPDAAATPMDHRGPYWSATQPTKGAPRGVPPAKMAMYSAITRPRMAGSVVVCT